jgi:hypothetical protein
VLITAGSTTVVWRDLPFCGGQYQHQVGARGDRTNLLHVCVLPLQSAAHLPKWSHNSEIRPWISARFFADGMIRSSHGKWWFDGWSILLQVSFSSLCVKQSDFMQVLAYFSPKESEQVSVKLQQWHPSIKVRQTGLGIVQTSVGRFRVLGRSRL